MYKSFKDIALNITEEEYRNDGNLHYSSIATYARGGFSSIATLNEQKTSESLLFGSLVDALLTSSNKEFNEKYFVADFPEIPQSYVTMAEALFQKFEIVCKTLDTISDEAIITIADERSFYTNWKRETRIKAIREKCSLYYGLLQKAINKTIVDTETYEKASAAAFAFRENNATKWYFNKDNPFDGIERIYQCKLAAEFDGIPYSAMPDLLIVMHNEKKIIPCDIKTTSHKEYEFVDSFIKWGYWIQAEQYAAIIRATIDKDDYFRNFKIDNYRFLVINKDSLSPLVWEWPHSNECDNLIVNGKLFKSFKTLGKELYGYLLTQQSVPNGIVQYGINNIDNWIKTEQNG